MIIDEITYAEGGIIQVKLKPIFEALRVIKHASTNSEVNSVRKEEKPTDSEVLEYLSNFIEIAVNHKVRTLETRIIPNKKAPEGSNFVNGAGSGLLLEPIKEFLYVVKSEYYQGIEDNLLDHVA